MIGLGKLRKSSSIEYELELTAVNLVFADTPSHKIMTEEIPVNPLSSPMTSHGGGKTDRMRQS